MDPAAPTAEAVAIRGDRFRAVGTVDELLRYPNAQLDERYADAVLLPGFVEAHSHAGTGNVWKGAYVGYVDRVDPNGVHWPGCTSIEAVVPSASTTRAATPTRSTRRLWHTAV
jgi:cytosine/adenosine deaminase-related metal-dependent hydrolase